MPCMNESRLMRSVEEARTLAAKHLSRHLQRYLVGELTGETVTFDVPLKPPTLSEARDDFSAVGRWVASWNDAVAKAGWQVEYVSKRWAGVGEQEVPQRASLRGARQVVAVSGSGELWARAVGFYEACGAEFSLVCGALRRAGDEVARAEREALAGLVTWAAKSSAVEDTSHWRRALLVAAWVVRNPDSGARLRSVPVAGIDTKWLEHHMGVVQRIVGVWRDLLGVPGGTDLGLHPKGEATFTVVWADPALRPGNMRVATVPLSELSKVGDGCRALWVFENLESVRAVPELPGVVVIHGGGKRGPALAQVPWIAARQITYWGDVDTHGFEILANMRRAGLVVESVMMDTETLDAHREFCGAEPSPSQAVAREFLTAAEVAALEALSADGGHVRLEQERINWDWALERLRRTL